MAHIKKLADGKYLIRVSRGTGPDRVWDNVTFLGKTRKEANEEAAEMQALLSGKFATLKFSRYFEHWIEARRSKIAPRTLDGYEGYIRRYALAPLKNIKLAKITDEHIQEILDGLALSSTTVRNLHAALRACFGHAVKKKGGIKVNPCKGAGLPAKKRAREIVVMDEDEAAAFNELCQTMPNGVIFDFALETGMRPEEYLALRWADIRGTEVMVQQAVQYNRKGGGYYFKDIKTPKGRRRIPITEHLRQRLVFHRRLQNEHRLAMKSTWFDHGLVFPNEIGRPYALNNLTRRYLTPIVDKCEFSKHLGLYALRHTMATLLLMSGENVKVVSERLGHATVTITLDTYSHVLPHIQERATDAMDNILRKRR